MPKTRAIRFTVLVAALLVVATAIAQDVLLSPRWKKGDVRTLYIQHERRTVENDTVTEDIQERMDVKARVMSTTTNGYMMELEYQNVVLRQVMAMTDKLGAEMDPYRKVVLRYEVDKRTGASVLYNWEDVRDMMNRSFDEVKRSLRKKDPAAADTLIMVMEPMMLFFQDKRMIEGYFGDHIHLLTFAYGKALQQGQPLVVTERTPNPFSDGRDTLTTTTTLHLESVDLSKNQCTIRAEEQIDMTPFIATMRSMMEQMLKAGGADKKKTAAARAELERDLKEMQFDARKQDSTTIDMETSWPVRIQRDGTALVKAKGKESLTTVKYAIEVR